MSGWKPIESAPKGRRPCIPRTLKPSERGPTNDEIIAATKERLADLGGFYSPEQFAEHALELQADQSWFKPEPEVDWAGRICKEARSWGVAYPENARLLRINALLAERDEALAKRSRVEAPSEVLEAMRRQGQDEGFASAVSWLRDRSAQKPAAYLALEADVLANGLENSRKAYVSLSQETRS